MQEGLGVQRSMLLSRFEALERYHAWPSDGPVESEIEQGLIDNAIARVPTPISSSDYQEFDRLFDCLLADNPPELAQTSHQVDHRYGFDAGFVRKEIKLNEVGQQIFDAKSLFHFNEFAQLKWEEQFTVAKGNRPKTLGDYLDAGYEIHREILHNALGHIGMLRTTHPNIDQLYAPIVDGKLVTMSFMRHLAYDGYDSSITLGEVARPHFDISGWTFQGHADASGFWGSSLPGLTKVSYDAPEGYAHMFAGVAHRLLYKDTSPIRPLWHGADRARPVQDCFVPVRHATILFVNQPFIDLGIEHKDTSPQLYD